MRRPKIIFDLSDTLVKQTSQGPQLFEGVREMLKTLSSKGYSLYVWTVLNRRSAQEMLQQLKMETFFEDISGGDDVATKPDPLFVCQFFNLQVSDTVVMIGDTAKDMKAAKNLSAISIGVLWNHFSDERGLKNAGAQYTVKSPQECVKLLEQILG